MDKEKELIIRSQKGDINAFEELISIYQQKIYNIAYFKTQDLHLAEDICQEVILRIFKKINLYKFRGPFDRWVYRVTCNVINNIAKKFRSVAEISFENVGHEVYESEKFDEDLDKKIKAEKLRKLILKIPHKFQIVLILYEFEGKSYEEIAEILGKNLNTVKTRLYRARQILKSLILKEAKELLE